MLVPRRIRRDLLLGLSLANLAFLRVWTELLTDTPADAYLMRHPPRPIDLAAAALNVLLLGAVLTAAAACARRAGQRALLEWGVLLFALFPLNAVRASLTHAWPILGGDLSWRTASAGWLAGAVLAAGAIAACAVRRSRVARGVAGAALVLSPLLLFTGAQAVVRTLRYDPAPFADRPAAPPVSSALPESRVLWLIFDEFDERLAFAQRPAGLRLPEFDAFRAESFVAKNAHSPGLSTLESMPALIAGRVSAGERQAGPSELLLTFPDRSVERWGASPTIFSRARRAGFDTGLTGWYHPYCRVLSDSLTECSWAEYSNFYNSTGDRWSEVLSNQLRSVVETNAISPFGQTVVVRHQAGVYRDVAHAAVAMAVNPHLGLVMAHLPVPHAPYIYSAATGRLDLWNASASAYFDALQLADRCFGDLRRAMQAAGLWDRTTVLVTADHGYRGAALGSPTTSWAPFMLKLAGQRQPYEYTAPLQTVVSADLLLEVLQRRVATAAEVDAWLVREGTDE
jgi:hypothetical protein